MNTNRHLYDHEFGSFIDKVKTRRNELAETNVKLAETLVSHVAYKINSVQATAQMIADNAMEVDACGQVLIRYEQVTSNFEADRAEDAVAQRWFEMIALDTANMIEPNGREVGYPYHLGRILNRYQNYRSAALNREEELRDTESMKP